MHCLRNVQKTAKYICEMYWSKKKIETQSSNDIPDTVFQNHHRGLQFLNSLSQIKDCPSRVSVRLHKKTVLAFLEKFYSH